jgi:membrane protein
MVYKIHNWLIKRLPPYRWFIETLQKATLPGLQGLRIYTVISFFKQGFSSKDINTRASAIAFNFFLALFPATIFFFTLIAYLPLKHFEDDIFRFIQNITPHNAFEAIKSTLEDILKNRQGGLLSLGFLLALYFSTNGINSLIEAFNAYTDAVETRPPWKQKLAALWLTLYVALLVVISIILTTVGNVVLNFLYDKDILGDSLEYYLLLFTKLILTVLFIYCLISGMFYFGPAKKRKWAFFSAGSTLATILSVITTYGFMMYVNNFNSYNKLYGSIGTLLVIMLLIFINAMVILIGFELNVSIDRALEHKLTTEQLTPKNLENTFKDKL